MSARDLPSGLHWRLRSTSLSAALALLALVAGCSGGDLELPVDTVVLVSIDSLRADHLGVYGYEPPTSPTIDRLAAKGAAFERAYSTTSWTLPSHAALLTGLDNVAHGVIDAGTRLPEAIETLAESLSAAGIRTTGFFSGPYLHPTFGMGQGFDTYEDCTSLAGEIQERRLSPRDHITSHKDVTNPALIEAVEGWLETGPSGRNFVFLHMWDVHYDYVPPERYVELFDPDYGGSLDGRNFVFNDRIRPDMRPRDLQHLIALYDGEIRYTDDTLGTILDALDEAGLLERAAVIVTADHGEEFFEHGKKGHRNNLFEVSVRVPLVVHVPGWSPPRRRIDQVVSLVDLYPTVCELFAVECDPRRPGQSLLGFLRGDAAQARGDALTELTRDSRKTRLYSLIRGEDKVVLRARRATADYYTDVAREGEGARGREQELAQRDPAARSILEQLHRRVDEARALGAALASGAPETPEVDPRMQQQLEALGYAEGESGP
ncbi:MAG: sulfatase [Myxococcota bacterium]|nr:sulfatase [Myxococcota bacterium]